MEQKQWSGIEFRPHETKSISKVIFVEIKFFTDGETLFSLKQLVLYALCVINHLCQPLQFETF